MTTKGHGEILLGLYHVSNLYNIKLIEREETLTTEETKKNLLSSETVNRQRYAHHETYHSYIFSAGPIFSYINKQKKNRTELQPILLS